MVLPSKIFAIKGRVDLESTVQEFKDFYEEESYETAEGKTLKLETEILDLNLKGDLVFGILSRDFVRRSYYKRRMVENLVTEEAPFWIKGLMERTFLIVVAPTGATGLKRLLAGHVANKLSEILFLERGMIVEVTIPHEILKELHESNPQATRLIWFDNVDIPSVEKFCLAGSDLADTKLYQDYLEHGNIWYVVFEAQKRGIVVGITRSCVVTLFSKATTDEFLDYLSEDILKLIE